MICPTDHTPMQTVPNSEKGKMTDTFYMTEEVKICPMCGKRVRERYEAERFVEKIKQNSAGQRNYEKEAGLKTGVVVTIEDVLRIVKQIQQKLKKK